MGLKFEFFKNDLTNSDFYDILYLQNQKGENYYATQK